MTRLCHNVYPSYNVCTSERLDTALGGGNTTGHNELFEQCVSIENLFLAWQRFCRGKRQKKDVLAYEFYLERNLFNLQEALAGGAWRHGPYQSFVVHDPKRRKIHKATVQDRVVHQAIINILEPIVEPQFIYHSYSCRKNKGTHAAVKQLHTFLRRASRNNTRTVYALKCDVYKFFDSVVHSSLLLLLRHHVQDVRFMNLLKKIMLSFEHAPGRGLPLGNLTSQLFANVYLNELDRFAKFFLREQWYIRYCDDFIIIHHDQHHLINLVRQLRIFLTVRLSLTIHPDKIFLRSWGQGVDFLGYVVLPHAVILRSRTRRKIIERVNERNLPSYLGICQHANAYGTSQLLRHLANIS